MADVLWTALFVGVTAIGISIVVVERSRMWVVAGLAYVVGGVGWSLYLVAYPGDVAPWFGTIGFFALLIAAPLTLIAMGRRGRRQFLVVFAAATLAVATYQFWTTNWVARFGDTATWCSDAGHALEPGKVERIPPRVQCSDGFAPADGVSWVALGGWSLFYGFAASFPIMGLAWITQRMGPPYRADFLGHGPT